MKILWTVSNWKRTGPLEPSLDLAAAVRRRGHVVHAALGRTPSGLRDETAAVLAVRGLPRALPEARLAKHAFFWRDIPDVRRLRRFLSAERPDVAVTTLANDHRLLVRAAARAGGPPVVRLWFGDGSTAVRRRERRALLATERVVCFGEAAAARLHDAGVVASRVVVTGPPLDVAGLRRLAGGAPGARERFAVPPGAFLFGIVARIQRHRRFEVLWDAVEALQRSSMPFRVLVIGRGTREVEVAREPVARRGLGDVALFAGYLRGADYACVLASLDAQILLVPGSDPTCRALREGMALGVPSVATRRGFLPEIVADGKTGLLVDEDGGSLAAAMARLVADPVLARTMGDAARRRADERFAADAVAERLERVLLDVTAG